jgi:hypothetical protein
MTRFLASVDTEGRIVPSSPARTSRHRGKDIWVELHEGPTESLRSSDSNKYLWGKLYRAICDETGNDPETIHLALKREAVRVGVLEPEYVQIGDHTLEADPTTRTDQATFDRYLRWVEDFALHKLGIHMEDHL